MINIFQSKNIVNISLLSLICFMFLLLSSCGEVRLAKNAARSTTEMGEKFDDVLDYMKKMHTTTNDIKKEMLDMQDQVDTVTEDMNEMQQLVSSMFDLVTTMAGNMDNMGAMLEQMLADMDFMKTSISAMRLAVGQMYDFMTDISKFGIQYFSKESRSSALEKLKDPKNNIESKLLQSTIYYYSFEYQTVSGDRFNSTDELSELLYVAVQEYFHDLSHLYKAAANHSMEEGYFDNQVNGFTSRTFLASNRKLNPGTYDISSKENYRNALYALSATMEKVNYHQLEYIDNPISFEDIMMDAVMARYLQLDPDYLNKFINNASGVTDGSDKGLGYNIALNLPKHLREALNWYPQVVFMLNMRHQFIDAMAVQKLSELDYVAKDHQNTDELLTQSSLFFNKWEVDYEYVLNNPAVLDKWGLYLEKSLRVRNFLNCFDLTMLDPVLTVLVKNLDTSSERYIQMIELMSQHYPQSVDRFKSAINNLKKDYHKLYFDGKKSRQSLADNNQCKQFVDDFIARLNLVNGVRGLSDQVTSLGDNHRSYAAQEELVDDDGSEVLDDQSDELDDTDTDDNQDKVGVEPSDVQQTPIIYDD